MSFELSDPPKYLELSDPSRIVPLQAAAIAEHINHWAKAYDKSVAEVDPGMHDINASFFMGFREIMTLDIPQLTQEKVRQYASGLLATSGLARILLAHPDFKVKDPYAVDDTAAKKAPDVLFDVEGVATFLHMTHEVYTLILPESGSPEQWYKDGDLFVRRTLPAEFSPFQQDWQKIKEPHMRSDPANMATLYPYLGRS